MKNKKQAFTLAEVLLVLAIIGVIAAVTIPAIMQQSSEKKFATLAKKAQSTLQNAIDLKIATVPIGPGDMGTNIFGWLLDGEDDGTNTLKAAKTSSNSRTIQTPDGMIFYDNTGTCSTSSTKTNLLGCSFEIRLDLNGSEGPTKTTVENASTTLYAARRDKKAYDEIFFRILQEGKVIFCTSATCSGTIIEEDKRAQKYLGL